MDDARPPDVELRAEIQHALREHAIELLRLGHQTLNAASFSKSEEEDITGKLKEAIERVIEVVPDSPGWVDHYTVYDEEKPSGTSRSGKRRPRIDITIKRRWKIKQSHPRFRFEAKRLKSDNRVTAYFGAEGIGCFLQGLYPLTHGEAGMIGYVQSGTVSDWQQRLGRYATRETTRLRVASGGEWKSFDCALRCSSITEHQHPTLPRLRIIHVLLSFV